MLSDETLVKLWKDPDFSGSYYSGHLFYSELQQHFQDVPSYSHVLKVLKSIPTYQIHSSFRDKKYFRHLDNVQGQGISIQADLAFMPDFNGYIGFLILVDEWNNYIYCEPFKSKQSSEIGDILLSLLDKNQSLNHVATISSDYGSEFLPLKAKLKLKNISWLFLRSSQKAFLAELYIKIVKGKIYRYLRENLTQDWPSALPQVTKAINNTYNHFLQTTPENSNNPESDPKIRVQWSKRKNGEFMTWQPRKEKYSVGDNVFKEFPPSKLYKGYHLKVRN